MSHTKQKRVLNGFLTGLRGGVSVTVPLRNLSDGGKKCACVNIKEVGNGDG